MILDVSDLEIVGSSRGGRVAHHSFFYGRATVFNAAASRCGRGDRVELLIVMMVCVCEVVDV